MTLLLEVIIAALLVLGGIFSLIGSYGLLKLRVPMQRLHAPTKATTIGVGSALIASALFAVIVKGSLSWHEVLVVLFLFLTAPLSALYLAKAHIFRTINPKELPVLPDDAPWATLAQDDAATEGAKLDV